MNSVHPTYYLLRWMLGVRLRKVYALLSGSSMSIWSVRCWDAVV